MERENAPSPAGSNSRVFTFESAPGLIRRTRDPSRAANPTETFTLNRAVSRATTSTSVQQIGFKAYAIIKQASCCIRAACVRPRRLSFFTLIFPGNFRYIERFKYVERLKISRLPEKNYCR